MKRAVYFVLAKRKSFEQKRKMHYNEFQAVKLARQLLEKDDDEELEDDEDCNMKAKGKKKKEKSKKEKALPLECDNNQSQGSPK